MQENDTAKLTPTYIGVLLTKSSPLAFKNQSSIEFIITLAKIFIFVKSKKLSGEFAKGKGERSYFHI